MDDHGFKIESVSTYRNEIYGLSILLIMLFHGYLQDVHFFRGIPVLHYLGRVIDHGNIGVEVFLLLSGISLYFSFEEDKSLNKYFKKRLLRIYTPLLLLRGTYWFVQAFKGNNSFSSAVVSCSGIRFWITGDESVWFVSVILLCYILYPFIHSTLYESDNSESQGIGFKVFLIVSIIMTFTYALSVALPNDFSRLEIGITRIPVFIIGCGLGRSVYKKRSITWLYLPLFVMLYGAWLVLEIKLNIPKPFSRWFMMVGAIPLLFLLAAISSLLPNILRAFFSFLGNMSLELYISHLMLRQMSKDGIIFSVTGSQAKWLLLLVLSIGTAFIAHIIPIMIKKMIGRRKNK